ncbi:ECF transporter S component [Alkalibacter rhizosphaerae]|uniref:ECF transporter S component n=1 Tax=Alkalibacter rhizosphaerae TaxID=2815577 RepID=A0A974XD15_9FIRM|nr:ECF transporter S component [Alkalibacter rhizosphaerae]QSX07416.1 ECF transporter S component [Alkalibacter rhizosphaerae]
MNKRQSDTGKLTFMAVMLAITIVFVMVTAIPNFSISMAVAMFLPTLLTAMVLGIKEGMIMGALAGAITLARALFMPLSPFDYFFINPLVSVLPRMFIGLAAGSVFRLIKNTMKAPGTVAAAVGGAIGMLTNTILVIGMLFVVHGQNMVDAMGAGFFATLGVLFASNGLIEMITAAVLMPILYNVYTRYKK